MVDVIHARRGAIFLDYATSPDHDIVDLSRLLLIDNPFLNFLNLILGEERNSML